jgi:hypothetical protein
MAMLVFVGICFHIDRCNFFAKIGIKTEVTKEILLNIARIQKKVFILACAFNDEH